MTATLGLGSVQCDCLTALVLNLNGNAITLSNDLWKRGVRDGQSLREEVLRSRHDKIFTFAVVSPVSSHRHLLRRWFAAQGIDPERDVRLVIVPPPQMVANLKTGNLDGFCVGEPWNSMAVQARAGWIAATTAQLDAMHPEKVLMLRGDFAANRHAEHVALIAALLEACEYCDLPENHGHLTEVLSHPAHVGVPPATLQHGFGGEMDFGHGVTRSVRDFCIFHRHGANDPSGEKAAWVMELIRASGLCPEPAAINFAFARRIFRADIFEQATSLRQSTNKNSEYESRIVHA
jgi:ABC-type nitrate/sulfonate/bicarbonate transport system substrate-binding protein